jgi:sulfatase maturation enzyme AslB (radical SAM superfamily)
LLQSLKKVLPQLSLTRVKNHLENSDAGVTGNVLLQWHGGEPLLIDPERCEGLIVGLNANTQGIKFLQRIERYASHRNKFTNA